MALAQKDTRLVLFSDMGKFGLLCCTMPGDALCVTWMERLCQNFGAANLRQCLICAQAVNRGSWRIRQWFLLLSSVLTQPPKLVDTTFGR